MADTALGAEDARERAGDLGGQPESPAGPGRRLGVPVPGQPAVQALDLVQPPDQADAVAAGAAGESASAARWQSGQMSTWCSRTSPRCHGLGLPGSGSPWRVPHRNTAPRALVHTSSIADPRAGRPPEPNRSPPVTATRVAARVTRKPVTRDAPPARLREIAQPGGGRHHRMWRQAGDSRPISLAPFRRTRREKSSFRRPHPRYYASSARAFW